MVLHLNAWPKLFFARYRSGCRRPVADRQHRDLAAGFSYGTKEVMTFLQPFQVAHDVEK